MAELRSDLFSSGRDVARNSGAPTGWDVLGDVNTQAGKDTVVGESVGEGSQVPQSLSLEAIGIQLMPGSRLDTGNGKDTVTGIAADCGIRNLGTLVTGRAKDVITGEGGLHGIFNDGVISTGRGRDVVNALKGGFSGQGLVDLGTSNDTLKGFGTGRFDGGAGRRDRVLLGEGTYWIDAAGGTISSAGVVMAVAGFEKIGGTRKGKLFDFETGILMVDDKGKASFSAVL
ncbi:hypothetical protein [Cyanobium sp. NIES-981]|uniref:hypothetical protein n=1 Tax=Cyanobium sp. NIES-981 TaxID=1851505 RepID=UPI0007DDE610|nr:hypothetical protein [Cyanobium sp. NIES-981]SBO42245.1 protein of unknown function [Cyanobium sp. NIES-981]